VERKLFKHYSLIIFVLLGLAAGCTKSPTSPGTGQWGEATAHANFSGRYGLSGTVFNNLMWVVGGAAGNADSSVTYYDADVWSSGNGSSWSSTATNAPFGGRYGSQTLSYNGQLWLIAGNSGGILKNDVWSSPDGKNWTQVLAPTSGGTASQFTPREDFGSVVFNNAMWVIGGYSSGKSNNDVWTSTDGVTWNKAVASAPFPGRWGMSTLVFNNAIWLMSGASGITPNSDPTAAYGDVWTSNNGTAWNQVSSGKISLTYYDQAVSNNNQIVLTFGFLWNDWGPQASTATSSDGINWNYTLPTYVARFGHLSLSYNNEAWVIGGCNNLCTTAPCPTTVTYFNDVWYSQ
jgi:hypothetical protein